MYCSWISMCWRAASGTLGIYPSHPCESCGLIFFCLSHAKKRWLCSSITNAAIVLVWSKMCLFPFRVLICSLKFLASILLQCHSAWRGQVCPYGQWPHDHGEDSQREEGHCAWVHPQSGNPRYVKNGRMLWECNVPVCTKTYLATFWMIDRLHSDWNDVWKNLFSLLQSTDHWWRQHTHMDPNFSLLS